MTQAKQEKGPALPLLHGFRLPDHSLHPLPQPQLLRFLLRRFILLAALIPFDFIHVGDGKALQGDLPGLGAGQDFFLRCGHIPVKPLLFQPHQPLKGAEGFLHTQPVPLRLLLLSQSPRHLHQRLVIPDSVDRRIAADTVKPRDFRDTVACGQPIHTEGVQILRAFLAEGVHLPQEILVPGPAVGAPHRVRKLRRLPWSCPHRTPPRCWRFHAPPGRCRFPGRRRP